MVFNYDMTEHFGKHFVGVDYFGPFEVKRGRGFIKRYGAIFTCMSSRAVHLEMAYSLDTSSCIHALCRFISRRGQVSRIRSDNGTNFVWAEREMREALSALNHKKIQDALLQSRVKWSFNTPAASHHGGSWERMICMIRNVLNSVLHQQSVDNEGLQTLLCEVEAILKDRPLTNSQMIRMILNPWLQTTSSCWKANLLYHLGFLRKVTCTSNDDGDRFSSYQISSGADGFGSTYHFSRNDNDGLRTRETLLQETLSSWLILLPLADPGCWERYCRPFMTHRDWCGL